MKYFNIEIQTCLEVRTIKRDEDIDLFIQTLGVPIHLEMSEGQYSRIQFPKAKALLLRMSPINESVTCHILRDVDLFSSFANFEVNKPLQKIIISQEDSYISLQFK